jgi:hypothetical protein
MRARSAAVWRRSRRSLADRRALGGVLRWHWTRISNGVLEGINSLVQTAKRRARGYRNKLNLIAMIYLIAGGLDFSPHPHELAKEPFWSYCKTSTYKRDAS